MTINAKNVLNHFGIDNSCVARAVQDTRARIEGSNRPRDEAHELIFQITGIKKHYPDETTAIHVAQCVVESVVKVDLFEPEDVIKTAEERSAALVKMMPWLIARPEVTRVVNSEVKTVIEGIDVKVEVKADGTMKKGGKQILAQELYRVNVHEAEEGKKLDNQGFIALLMKELGMTKAGATTYNYNMKKLFGGTITPKGKK
jgi:hypothetical protein